MANEQYSREYISRLVSRFSDGDPDAWVELNRIQLRQMHKINTVHEYKDGELVVVMLIILGVLGGPVAIAVWMLILTEIAARLFG